MRERSKPRSALHDLAQASVGLAERVLLAAGHFHPLRLELLMQTREKPAAADAEKHREN